MKFGPVPLSQAEGTILAHSIEVKGAVAIRKGTRLSQQDIARLRHSDIETVIVARLEEGDVHEDAAADTLAKAIVPEPHAQGLRYTQASKGRVNLYAETMGVLRVDVAAVNQLNQINPMITLATLPPFQRVAAGDMVATVKIISYAVPQSDLTRAAEFARQALSVAAPIYASASMIETTVSSQPASMKGWNALKGRLHRLGVMLEKRTLVPHQEASLAEALVQATGEVLFILTGSATSDLYDVAPEALRRAGGEVVHYGMPVDPGNLLFLGRLGEKPVIGLPGCARSSVMNGADWVLERVICGVPVGPKDIAAMGVGGLLKEIPSRRQPREVKDP